MTAFQTLGTEPRAFQLDYLQQPEASAQQQKAFRVEPYDYSTQPETPAPVTTQDVAPTATQRQAGTVPDWLSSSPIGSLFYRLIDPRTYTANGKDLSEGLRTDWGNDA
jgi:hypothetical protein